MIETFTTSATHGIQSTSPDTCAEDPPRDHPDRATTWQLGHHPRLGRLAARIRGVIYTDDENGDIGIDLDHLGDMFAAEPAHDEAWAEYERRNRPPEDDEGTTAGRRPDRGRMTSRLV